MKLSLIIASILFTGQAFGGEIRGEVYCFNNEAAPEIQIKVALSDFKYDEKVGPTKASSASTHYTLSVVTTSEPGKFAPYQEFDATTVSGKNVKNQEYNARKYKGHYKFSLEQDDRSNFTFGKLEYDHANLIFNPEYTVAKSFPGQNQWDKTWTWTNEVRKHSAVLDLSLNDHHGDYVDLECYSTGTVNDSKGRK